MSCDLEYSVVHSYFDGELSVIRAAEFRHHLAHCMGRVCRAEFSPWFVKYARLTKLRQPRSC
jgi:hypothetical protein